MRVHARVAMPVLAMVLVAVLAAPAVGGGWATVELSSTPDGVRAGEKWTVDLTVLQHGRTPLAGVQPEVRVAEAGGGRTERFAARATEETGVYRVDVVFPAAGRWEYRVDDGFGQIQTYPAVRIAEAAPPVVDAAGDAAPVPAGSDLRWPLIVAAVAGGVLAAGLTFAIRRRRGEGDPGASAGAAPTSA